MVKAKEYILTLLHLTQQDVTGIKSKHSNAFSKKKNQRFFFFTNHLLDKVGLVFTYLCDLISKVSSEMQCSAVGNIS